MNSLLVIYIFCNFVFFCKLNKLKKTKQSYNEMKYVSIRDRTGFANRLTCLKKL